MGQDMRTDVELLNAILNEAPRRVDRQTGRMTVLSAKTLAWWTQRSLQTVSDYRTGKTNIPVEFWRRILERTFDLRIIGLLIPGSILFESLPEEEIRPHTARDFFREAIASEGEHHEKQKYLCDILADGRVDELDASSVTAYDDAYWQHRRREAVLHRSIVHCFQQCVAAQESPA